MKNTASIDMSVQFVKGVGEKRAQLFSKIGVNTLYDLVHLFPRTYLDFSKLTAISALRNGEVGCVCGTVCSEVSENEVRYGMTVYKCVVSDGEGVLHITIFNNRFLAQKLTYGKELIFMGKAQRDYGTIQMTNPIVESTEAQDTLRPIYPQTAGLSSLLIEKAVKNALSLYYKDESESDIIPDEIRRRFSLCHEKFALQSIHFPKSGADAEIAKRRLIFEELLVLQSGMLAMRKKGRGKTEYTIKKDYSEEFSSLLPFTLTEAQKRACNDCISDLFKGEPMNRLLQGDVGSGKTAVAAGVIFTAVKNSFQCAMMAPTEVLANQHYKTLTDLFGDKIRVAVLTGSTTAKEKKRIKEKLSKGEIDVLVGTHAIITDDTQFNRLGLVITDEQHRFGVRQRTALSSKGKSAHVLVMSATPIPRTLSLILYGDLDISVIDTMPVGRQKTKTYCVDSSYRQRIYAYIKKQLDSGFQCYIVCPLVEENESDLVSATEYAKGLEQSVLGGYNIALLHGKMKPKEKNKIMQDFANGEIKLLVSTTVIEVGIDVANATTIVIENAERFGLSTLHQLRGRVGRGKTASTCILISDNEGEETKKRLNIICKTTDGFKIADEDLKIRGPGDFFGSRQHGLPPFRIADMLESMVTVSQAQEASREIFALDPKLQLPQHKRLRSAVIKLFKDAGNAALN